MNKPTFDGTYEGQQYGYASGVWTWKPVPGAPPRLYSVLLGRNGRQPVLAANGLTREDVSALVNLILKDPENDKVQIVRSSPCEWVLEPAPVETAND